MTEDIGAGHPGPGGTLLTIGYSALADRTDAMLVPHERDGIEVLVCVQGGQGDVTIDDATVVGIVGRGVARSRNAVMDHARGRYLLFCDDDVVVNVAGVLEGVRYLERSGHALALGRGVDPAGLLRKAYPRTRRRLTLLNTAKAATYEMLIDLDQVRAKQLRFDVRFGAGAAVRLGDEYVFIADMLRAGLTGSAVPWVFGMHSVVSSGSLWGTARDSHERAVVLNRVFDRWAPLARLAFAAKNWRRFGANRLVLAFLSDGSRPPA